MATEVAIFPLHDGKYPDDANSAAGQVLKDTFDTLTQQPGFQRAYWGREVENPGTFRLFVDWDSVEKHTEFTKTETYKPFLEQFGQIAKIDQAQLYHVHLTPHPADEVLSDHVSPATEILTLYFPANFSRKEEFVKNLKQFISTIENDSDTHTSSAGGWVEEELTIPGTSEKGTAYQCLLGWTSVEAHMAHREKQSFKDNIHLIRGDKDLKHLAVVHYHGTQINKGAGGVGDVSDGNAPLVQEEVLNPQAGKQDPPKTRSDGTTTKNNDDLKGAANSLKKERAGR